MAQHDTSYPHKMYHLQQNCLEADSPTE